MTVPVAMTMATAFATAFAATAVRRTSAFFVTIVVAVVVMAFAIAGNVLAVVPVIPDEIDALATGAVFRAVLGPMLGMARRNAQINGRSGYRNRRDDHRTGIDQYRRGIASDVDTTIEARLADIDRNAHVGRMTG